MSGRDILAEDPAHRGRTDSKSPESREEKINTARVFSSGFALTPRARKKIGWKRFSGSEADQREARRGRGSIPVNGERMEMNRSRRERGRRIELTE